MLGTPKVRYYLANETGTDKTGEALSNPMTDDEILEFRDGLTKLLTDPVKSRKLDAPMTTRETYSLVCELADKIEAERKAKTADIEM